MKTKHPDSPVPAKIISARSVAIMAVLFAVSVMIGPTIKMSLDKVGEVSELEKTLVVQQKEQNEYKREVKRWHDPHYVKQQARDRINMVMPGETAYWVTGADAYSSKDDVAVSSKDSGDEEDWISRLSQPIQK